jgi:hypothetical protein
MRSLLIILAGIGVVLLLNGQGRADELSQNKINTAEKFPPVPPQFPAERIVATRIDYIRPNPYDVWQIYIVDRFGFFRPRVVPTSTGFRYLYNGSPFPWGSNYPGEFAPILVQPGNFAGEPVNGRSLPRN